MKVKDLRPLKNNPRKITEKKLKMMGKSMREFGDLSGIIFNRQTGNLIAGHQRIKHFDPNWEIDDGFIRTSFGDFVFREVDWDSKKEMIANIAANKHSGEWDISMLENMIEQVNNELINIELTGFEQQELQNLFGIAGPQINIKEESDFYTLQFKFLKDDAAFVQEKLHKNREENDESLDDHWRERCLLRLLRMIN